MVFKIGTYNVLGLTGFPASESKKEIDIPGTEKNTEHFFSGGHILAVLSEF